MEQLVLGILVLICCSQSQEYQVLLVRHLVRHPEQHPHEGHPLQGTSGRTAAAGTVTVNEIVSV